MDLTTANKEDEEIVDEEYENAQSYHCHQQESRLHGSRGRFGTRDAGNSRSGAVSLQSGPA